MTAIVEIWTAIVSWFVSSITSIVDIFYTEGEFTIIGVLALATFGIGLVTLVIRYVQGFIKSR